MGETCRGAGGRRRPARRRRAAGLPRPPAGHRPRAVFVLALARPELLARRPDLGGRRASVVRLEPLDDVAMATLVDGLVVGLPPAARAALVARAEGMPLFAVETVRALIDRDLVVPRGGRYVPADGVVLDLDAIGAPASLQALVAARLDALTPEEKRVVADASVLGASFTRDGLVALGSDPDDLDGVLASLVRKEIVVARRPTGSAAERGQYRFVQSVVRQVAYATQSRRDRKTRHLAAADYLTPSPIPATTSRWSSPSTCSTPPRERLGRAEARRPECPGVRLPGAGRTQGAPGGRDERFPRPARAAPSRTPRGRATARGCTCSQQTSATTLGTSHRPVPMPRPRSCSTTAWTTPSGRDEVCRGPQLLHPRQQRGGGGGHRRTEVAGARWRGRSRTGPVRAGSRAEQAHADSGGVHDRDPVRRGDAHPGRLPRRTGGRRHSTGRPGNGVPHPRRLSRRRHPPRERGRDRPRARPSLPAGPRAEQPCRVLERPRPGGRPPTCPGVRRGRASSRAGGVGTNAMVNYAIGLWCAGRCVELAEIIPNGLKAAQPGMAFTWWALDVWLADAAGTSPPPPLDEPDTDAQSDLAWRTSGDLSRALTAGDPAEVARTPRSCWATRWPRPASTTTSSSCGPRWCRALLSIGDLDLAERLDRARCHHPARETPSRRRRPVAPAAWSARRGPQ